MELQRNDTTAESVAREFELVSDLARRSIYRFPVAIERNSVDEKRLQLQRDQSGRIMRRKGGRNILQICRERVFFLIFCTN